MQQNMRTPATQNRYRRTNNADMSASVINPRGCCNCNCFVCVTPDEILAEEHFGKFKRIRNSGCHFLGCDYGGKVIKIRKITTRMQEIQLFSETKTKDDVFVELVVAVQVAVDMNRGYEAIYRLDNPVQQIESYVADVIRGVVPKCMLDHLFEAKDEIANAVKERLDECMTSYGFTIHQVLVTDLRPDDRVKHAMNEIDANRRLRTAMIEKAEARRIQVVKAAEGDAESMFLQGQGIARQRLAIVEGLRSAVYGTEEMDPHAAKELLLTTQHFDCLAKLAEGRNTTVYMPHSIGYLAQICKEIKNGVLGNRSTPGTTFAAPKQIEMGTPGYPPKKDEPTPLQSI